MANSYKDPFYDSIDQQVEEKLGLPDGLLSSIRTKGERSNADQVSEAGARSVYQIIPATRNAIKKKHGFDPYESPENAAMGAGLLLKESLARNGNDPVQAVGEYIGGTDRKNWGPVTKAYIGRVTGGAPEKRSLASELKSTESSGIAGVHAAYKAGKMTPEDAAAFEESVNSGAILLPRGMQVKTPDTIPYPVIEAYTSGRMSPEDAAAFKAAVDGGKIKVPKGMALAAPGSAASQIPVDNPAAAQVPQQQPEPGFMDQVVGAGEAALTLATGATGGAIGMIGGAARGLGESIVNGQFGTQQGVDTVNRNAQAGAQALTYAPRTQAGKDQVGAVGSALEFLPPVAPVISPVGGIAQSVKASAPMVAQAAKTAVAPAARAVKAIAQPAIDSMPGRGSGASAAPSAGRSAGAAATSLEGQRIATAESLPVPLTGDAALTKGQATRDAGTIKFEQEIMQQGENGAPVRSRVENQSAVLNQNFQTLVDRIDPATTEIRDLGKNVDVVLKNKMGVANKRISNAYQKARDAGEMEEPIELTTLVPVLDDLDRFAGVASNVNAIKKEAVRLGAVSDSGAGLVPAVITLDQSELLRQFVNQATDWTDKRQSMVAKRVNGAIDQAMDGAGGDAYKAARKLKTDYMREFDNVGLTKKLTTTKRGTDERRVAYADVFETIIVDSPLEEMNKMRRTLITAGPDGKQAWNDLKAKGIEYIKEKSSSKASTDQRGNETLSVAKLNNVIDKLDKEGKLESLYGKKQAQTLRDLAELSKVIYTAPPGAINTSGTASAIINAIDTIGTFGITGVPVPAVAVLRQSAKYIKNRETRRRIQESLNYTKAKP